MIDVGLVSRFKLIPRTGYESDRNKCVDEANRNNQIQLIDCNKVVGRFTLKNHIYFDVGKKQKEANAKKTLPEPSLLINKLTAGHQSTYSDYFICSRDDQVFQQTLGYSLDYNSELLGASSAANERLSLEGLSSNFTNVGYFEFDSGLLPHHFDLNHLFMLYFEIPPDLPYKSDHNGLLITFSVLVVLFIAIVLALSVVNFLFFLSKSNYGNQNFIFNFPFITGLKSDENLRSMFCRFYQTKEDICRLYFNIYS